MQAGHREMGRAVAEVKGDLAAQTTGDDGTMMVIQILQTSAKELRRRAEKNERLIAAALEGGDVKDMLAACPPLDCPHRRKLRETLVEAIFTLEDTRKSFKSKQLEALRKNLIEALAENA